MNIGIKIYVCMLSMYFVLVLNVNHVDDKGIVLGRSGEVVA